MVSIKKKLLFSFFIIIAALLIAEAFLVAMDRLVLIRYRSLSDNMISEYRLTEYTSALVESFNKRIKSPASIADIDDFNAAYSNTKDLLYWLDRAIVNNRSRIIFSGLENNIYDIIYDVEIGVNNLNHGDYLEAVNRYEDANRKNVFVQDNVSRLLLEELKYSKNIQEEIDRINLISEFIALALFLMAVGGCIWYALYFSKTLVNPLEKLTGLAKVIEGGDLTATVDERLMRGKDEIASLANSFHTMIFFLRNNIKKLQEYNLEVRNSRNHLKSEKQKLQQYLDVAGVIVLIFDVNNNVLLINKRGREILNVEAGEIMGKDWVESFVKKGDRIKTRSLLNFLVGNISPVDTVENVLITKDKVEKHIVWRFSILRNENNTLQGILGTGVDVTELAAAKVTINQLKEVDRLKNEVLNIATHELKTPLVSIVGLSEVMQKQPKTIPDDYKEFIALIHTEGLKLSNLIKTMLTASRNEIGKTAVNIEPIVFDELVMSMETSLGVLAKRSDSRVVFNIEAKNIEMQSDKLKISQVVYNFVDNAVKYGPKNQDIFINVSKPDDNSVRLAVTGAGQGISQEKQKSLFLKFSQLEPSLSRSQDGMGLGLYICKQNIESLGGEIGVISDIGQGATFFFTLPLIYRESEAATALKSLLDKKNPLNSGSNQATAIPAEGELEEKIVSGASKIKKPMATVKKASKMVAKEVVSKGAKPTKNGALNVGTATGKKV